VKTHGVFSARLLVEASIDNLIEEFVRHPYLHRREHSLHLRFYELLKSHEQLTEIVPLGFDSEMTQLVHKEWPETLSRDGKPKRGNFDFAILPPAMIGCCPGLEYYQAGRLPAPIVVEMGLDCSRNHLAGDAKKLINSNPLHGYLVHLVRGCGRDPSTEELILDSQKIQESKRRMVGWTRFGLL
jgi:hypothetical protein